ncbi:hypothetical protein STRAU_6865 [Streptomyces aurantiacus JA 4570]|uniref:Uncharacterized protein n=1 Tax=Streptomyces aurantiacus JA 4570 TaxID=1286094 RepID=S3ZP46_9ACTN|nr:hypothetical protein STRAU_6865 [Streptomyces aurantiacus JA 4570]
MVGWLVTGGPPIGLNGLVLKRNGLVLKRRTG